MAGLVGRVERTAEGQVNVVSPAVRRRIVLFEVSDFILGVRVVRHRLDLENATVKVDEGAKSRGCVFIVVEDFPVSYISLLVSDTRTVRVRPVGLVSFLWAH